MRPRVRIDASSRLPLDPPPDEDEVEHPAPSTSPYIELEARTNFSFLQAASSPEALVRRAAELGYNAIGITDKDGLYGVVRALEEGTRQNVRVVVGCDLTLGASPPHASMLVHVETLEGYSNLCQILTRSHALHPKGKPRKREERVPRNCFAGVDLETVCAHAPGLWATVPAESIGALGDLALGAIVDAFGARTSLRIVRHLDGDDALRLMKLEEARARYDLPVCVTNAVRYARREDKPLFDVLTCIRECITLDQGGRALAVNAEARLKSAAEMAQVFKDHLFEGKDVWLARSRDIAESCLFSMRDLKYQFPFVVDDPSFEGETPDQALRRLSYSGARERYPEGVPDKVQAQIEKELALIAKRNVAPFFLSVRSVVEAARKRDILCQGRGSAANSAVCYCIGVTAVDPARSNLLFERFLSTDREEPPDIDVDFEHERREEVIQHIYRTYGRDRAAMVSEVISYRGKSALRDTGKAFGLTLAEVDKLSSLLTYWDRVETLEDARIRAVGLDPGDPRLRRTLEIAHRMQGTPRHLSIHVGGFVLSSTPLHLVAPVEPATMKDRTIIPWDKDDLDTLGFFKLDVLGLGMLTALRKALALAARRDPRIQADSAIAQLAKIPAEDSTVYDALCRADTVGVFQIESRAQMSMLPRLKPRAFYDLVVEVAIVRPGPIQGGMVHPYLKRRAGEEKIVSPHPILDPILGRTLGVPIFQEQVMQIAIVGAGYSGAEADTLRRDMAAWRKTGQLERHQRRLTEGFLARGISTEFAERLYSQMKGFADYGFPESHAASFALLVYASAWIKVHHPAAFAAALINSQPMGFYSPSALLQDARRHGVTLAPISILESDWDCTLEDEDDERGPTLRVGLRLVKGLGADAGARIEEARRAMSFDSVEDLAARAKLDRKELDALAESGALEPMVPGRRRAMWRVRAPKERALFAGVAIDPATPPLPKMTRATQLSLDYARTGVSLTDHPMKLARAQLGAEVLDSRAVSSTATPGELVRVAGLVTCRQRPQTASGVVFMTLEDEHGMINVVLFNRIFERFRHEATQHGMLLVRGKLERSSGVTHVIAEHLEPLEVKDTELPWMSRDFH